MADIVRFVDSIVASPATRLDLNDGAVWGLNYDGTDLSPPPLKEAWAGTLLADGEIQTASVYGNRTIKLNLDLIAASVDDAAAKIQALWRELDRAKNVLMWQPQGATQPVFFRTLRSSSNHVVEYPGGGDLRTVDVTITAEPFAYGPKETLPQVTVYNDPAAASNGCFFDITGVKGDVETPLLIRFTGLAQSPRRTSAFAVRRRGTPANARFVCQAEALSLGTDTTLPGNDSGMSGSGNNYARCSFATSASSLIPRVYGYVTGTTQSQSVDYRGTYRVYAMVRETVSSDQFKLQLEWGAAAGGTLVVNDAVSWPGSGGAVAGLVDLGLLQMPVGGDPVNDGYSGVDLPATSASIYVQAQRVSGTGSLDFDFLLFVPADDRLLLVQWPSSVINSGDLFVVDGAHEMVYAADASTGAVKTTQAPGAAGGFPLVSPGVTNRVYFLSAVDQDSNGVATTGANWTFLLSYYPRYLYVRSATS